MHALWTEKHFPQTFDQFIGNSELVQRVNDWAGSWAKGLKAKPLLLHGHTGTGKTCLALLAAKVFQWDVFELNASDLRDEESIERLAGSAAFNSTFTGRPRLVLLDEIDGLQGRDRGGHSAVQKILKESSNPVICTANDLYADSKLSYLRSACELLEFKKINYLSIAKFLRETCVKEGVPAEDEALKSLAKNASGDLRSALLDVQCLALSGRISLEDVSSMSGRERGDNIFNVMRNLFHAHSFKEARDSTFRSDVDDDMLQRWIEENIPVALARQDLPAAFNWVSRADVFAGRIRRRQHWGFKKYVHDLSTAGVVMQKTEKVSGWVRYQFPKIISLLGRSKPERTLRKQLALKIGKKVHSSSSGVLREDLPFLKQLMESEKLAIGFTAYFDLEPEELAYLLDSKPDSKKVSSIFEQAQSVKQVRISEKRKLLAPIAADNPTVIPVETETPGETVEPSKGQTRLFG